MAKYRNHPSVKRVTWTPKHELTHQIEWPNGLGYTPCTAKYFDVHTACQDAGPDFDKGENLDNIGRERYETYCRLDNDRANLQADGECGKGVRY